MPLFEWAGPGKMREVDHTRAVAPEIEEPAGVGLGSAEKTQLFECTVKDCGKRFKKTMILARHFNANHEAEHVDKDSWRDYYQEVWE